MLLGTPSLMVCVMMASITLAAVSVESPDVELGLPGPEAAAALWAPGAALLAPPGGGAAVDRFTTLGSLQHDRRAVQGLDQTGMVTEVHRAEPGQTSPLGRARRLRHGRGLRHGRERRVGWVLGRWSVPGVVAGMTRGHQAVLVSQSRLQDE